MFAAGEWRWGWIVDLRRLLGILGVSLLPSHFALIGLARDIRLTYYEELVDV